VVIDAGSAPTLKLLELGETRTAVGAGTIAVGNVTVPPPKPPAAMAPSAWIPNDGLRAIRPDPPEVPVDRAYNTRKNRCHAGVHNPLESVTGTSGGGNGWSLKPLMTLEDLLGPTLPEERPQRPPSTSGGIHGRGPVRGATKSGCLLSCR
jgi:hypothetical protein